MVHVLQPGAFNIRTTKQKECYAFGQDVPCFKIHILFSLQKQSTQMNAAKMLAFSSPALIPVKYLKSANQSL